MPGRIAALGVAATAILLAFPGGPAFAGAACAPGPASSGGVKISVTPPTPSLMDTPLAISVTGLQQMQLVVLEVCSVDASSVLWDSQTLYYPNSRSGQTANLILSPPLSPTPPAGSCLMPPSGTSSTDSMRPIDNMTPNRAPPGTYPGAYQWAGVAHQFTFNVRTSTTGPVIASATVWRAPSAGLAAPQIAQGPGFYGKFFKPASPTASSMHNRAAVVMFGGSEGGLSNRIVLAAGLLASRGYPTLALAYWQGQNVPATAGLSASISEIPLENFVNAIKWLRNQRFADGKPVNPNRIFVSGTSYGSEAALLLAAVPAQPGQPRLVWGAIANVPSSVMSVCYPQPGCNKPGSVTPTAAWSVSNTPLAGVNGSHHTDGLPSSWIPAQNITGPVFLDCGEADNPTTGVWWSCPAVDDMRAQITGPVVHVECVAAGHGIGGLVPYSPTDPTGTPNIQGTEFDRNQIADALLWPQLLRFLNTYSN